jgi:UMF1 family MFS transporter
MDSAIEFWILAIMVAIGQGGIQALSRSFYAELIPKEKSAEFYSFFSISEKFACIFGPFIFGLVSQFTSSPRNGVFSLLGFFIAGWLILLNVKEPEKQKGRTA